MKRSILTALALIILCGCSGQAASRSNSPSDSYSSEEVISVQSAELKRFVFNSAEDVIALSDDDLIYIANNRHRYANSDFFSDISDSVDLFEIPLVEKEIDVHSCTERVETYMLESDIPIEELDVYQLKAHNDRDTLNGRLE